MKPIYDVIREEQHEHILFILGNSARLIEIVIQLWAVGCAFSVIIRRTNQKIIK